MDSYGLVIVSILSLVLCIQVVLFWKLYQGQKEQYQLERMNWERERERLLNRAMTKTWESYVQMTQSLNPSLDSWDKTPAKGLSDEEELRRWGGSPEGVGETIFDMTEELQELGIIKEPNA